MWIAKLFAAGASICLVLAAVVTVDAVHPALGLAVDACTWRV